MHFKKAPTYMSSESKYVGPPQPHARLIAGKELIPKGDGFVYSILLLIDQKMSILHHKKILHVIFF